MSMRHRVVIYFILFVFSSAVWTNYAHKLSFTSAAEIDNLKVKKVKVRITFYGLENHHRAMERHLPCGITQCYLPPDAGERAPS